MVPFSFSRAFIASTEFTNVTKPNPYKILFILLIFSYFCDNIIRSKEISVQTSRTVIGKEGLKCCTFKRKYGFSRAVWLEVLNKNPLQEG